MVYLTIHSTHCIRFSLALNIWLKTTWRERNVLFNDALNTFHLRLYGVGHMVKDHSDSERRNPLPPHRLLFPISSKGSFICHIPQVVSVRTAESMRSNRKRERKEGRKEMLYLTIHSTHFISFSLALNIWLKTTWMTREKTQGLSPFLLVQIIRL